MSDFKKQYLGEFGFEKPKTGLDRVIEFLESEEDECPESWISEGLKELARLREIAACFEKGDVAIWANIAERFNMPCPDGAKCEVCAAERRVINSAHKAAKLAEEEVRRG